MRDDAEPYNLSNSGDVMLQSLAAMYVEEAAMESLKLLELILPVMFIGLVVANILFSLPQFGKVSILIARITSFGNLKSGLAIAAFLAHPVAATSMLAEMHRKRMIDEKEVMIANVIGVLPRSLRAVILFLAPIGLPALGLKVGLIYISLTVISRIVVAMGCIVVGARVLDGGDLILYSNNSKLRDCLYSALKQFFRITAMLIPTIFLVTFLFELGLLDTFSIVKPVLDTLGLPDSSLLIIATGMLSMIVGIGTAGSLLAMDAIDEFSTVLSLLIASIFHSVIECLRNTLPINISLFGELLGVKVTVTFLLAQLVAGMLAVFLLMTLGFFMI